MLLVGLLLCVNTVLASTHYTRLTETDVMYAGDRLCAGNFVLQSHCVELMPDCTFEPRLYDGLSVPVDASVVSLALTESRKEEHMWICYVNMRAAVFKTYFTERPLLRYADIKS